MNPKKFEASIKRTLKKEGYKTKNMTGVSINYTRTQLPEIKIEYNDNKEK